MRIDENVENQLREAYSAAIDRNGDRLTAALASVDPAQSEHALRLSLFVCGSVTKDIFGEHPTDDVLHTLAQQVVDGESGWFALDVTKVAGLLRMTVGQGSVFGTVEPAEVPALAVVCAGHLLAAFRGEGQRWWQYLDEILDDLLVVPEQD